MEKKRFASREALTFETRLGLVNVNADTTRDAIERMVRHAQRMPHAEWHVIANERGTINKVVFDPDDTHEGWYAYLRDPLTAPATL